MAESDELPIACALTPAERDATPETLLVGLAASAVEREEEGEGFRWRFEARPGLLGEIAEVLERERRCCPFLRFEIRAEPGEGPVWLRVDGPPGTRTFLEGLLGPG